MPRPRRRRPTALLLLALSCAASPGPAFADEADGLRREIETLRRQLATLTQSYEQRLKTLAIPTRARWCASAQVKSQRTPAPRPASPRCGSTRPTPPC